jgi:glycosyltransferase involved in cell wall biosynthesis
MNVPESLATVHPARSTRHFRYHPPVRLAYFSPLPPVKSGIADYTVELLGELGTRHQIEVFVGSSDELDAWPAGRGPFAVRNAHEFVWARARTPYDLIVYQVGNAWCHDYMWPYLFKWPGLVVLHDAHLHHARAWSLLRRGREADYRAELAFNHPALPAEAAEIGLSGYAGSLYYFWPMLRAVVSSARAVAVHNQVLAEELGREFAGTAVHHVPMGVAPHRADAAAVEAVRARHGLHPSDVVFAAFGAVTPEKRLVPIVRALQVARRYVPAARLLLVGQTMPHFDPRAVARSLGVADHVVVTGFVEDAELPAYLAASDVVFALRWPSARETSASWLRAIAAGRPTVVTDLAQQASLPALDPRSWTVVHAQPFLTTPEPVAVAVEVIDEQHSLTLAVRRLATDPALRTRLGSAARAYWAASHTLGHMAAAYDIAVHDSARRRDPEAALPAHLRPDPSAFAQTLVNRFPGVNVFE